MSFSAKGYIARRRQELTYGNAIVVPKENGDITPYLVYPDTRCNSVVTFTSLPLYPREIVSFTQ
jgi:hypothetical protein